MRRAAKSSDRANETGALPVTVRCWQTVRILWRGRDHSDNVSRRTVIGCPFPPGPQSGSAIPSFPFVRHRRFCKTIHAQAANSGQFVHFIHDGQQAVCRLINCIYLISRHLLRIAGGEGGIRTPDTRQGMAAFEAARFNRSRTSPHEDLQLFSYLPDQCNKKWPSAERYESHTSMDLRVFQVRIAAWRLR